MKTNILQLITGLGVGGAERVVLDLSIGLNKDKYNNFIISLSEKNEMLNTFRKNNLNVISLNKKNNFLDFISIIFEIKNFIKKNNINIIHAHMTHSMIISVLIKIFFPKLKIIYTSHSTNFGSRFRTLLIYLLKTFRTVDILFSEKQKASIYKKDYIIIPNGIDTKKYQLKLKKFTKFTFLSVGRLEEAKNHIHLIECAKDLSNKNIDFEILIAGEGSLRNILEEKIKEYRLADKVKLLGMREDIKELMSQTHVFVMTSLWEGLPIVLLEAGASNLPCISTPVGTISSLVNDSNGYLVDHKNFSKTMEYVYFNYNEAVNKSKKLNKIILQNYSIDTIVKSHEKIYDFHSSIK